MRHLQAQAGRQGVLYIVAVQSQEESNSETRLTALWCMGLKQVYKIFDMPLGFEMLGKMARRLHILIFKKVWKKTWFMSHMVLISNYHESEWFKDNLFRLS